MFKQSWRWRNHSVFSVLLDLTLFTGRGSTLQRSFQKRDLPVRKQFILRDPYKMLPIIRREDQHLSSSIKNLETVFSEHPKDLFFMCFHTLWVFWHQATQRVRMRSSHSLGSSSNFNDRFTRMVKYRSHHRRDPFP